MQNHCSGHELFNVSLFNQLSMERTTSQGRTRSWSYLDFSICYRFAEAPLSSKPYRHTLRKMFCFKVPTGSFERRAEEGYRLHCNRDFLLHLFWAMRCSSASMSTSLPSDKDSHHHQQRPVSIKSAGQVLRGRVGDKEGGEIALFFQNRRCE